MAYRENHIKTILITSILFWYMIGVWETFSIRMGYSSKEKDDEFNFDGLAEGVYFFSGEEGFVKVEVDKDGHQTWNLQNWFASLDPDKNEMQRQKTIQDIKRRINAETGIINKQKKQSKKNYFNLFKN